MPRRFPLLSFALMVCLGWLSPVLLPLAPGDQGPGLAWAYDGDDGDDGDDGGGVGAASGGSAASAGDSGSDADPGPQEPAPAASAGGFVADELIAINPTAGALQRAAAWGASPVQTSRHGQLGLTVVRLRLPPGIDARSALALAEERDPGVFDLHHRYEPAQGGGSVCDVPGCDVLRAIDWPAGALCGRGQTIGLVDTAITPGLPALRGADVQQRTLAPAGRAAPDDVHCDAVATLLAGQAPRHAGLLPAARLRVAAPFHRLGNGLVRADAAALVASLEWLLQQRATVIGLSLAGPPNRALQAAVAAAQARGALLVAAVGNGGRTAEPAHPAALPDVLGATAVSLDGRAYWRAQQGDSVDFALPGVGLTLPQADGTLRARSGTSFAVPFLVAKVSQSIAEGALRAQDWLAGEGVPARDLGPRGRDAVFGWGLPRVTLSCR
jgi:minor extracellular protease Epr